MLAGWRHLWVVDAGMVGFLVNGLVCVGAGLLSRPSKGGCKIDSLLFLTGRCSRKTVASGLTPWPAVSIFKRRDQRRQLLPPPARKPPDRSGGLAMLTFKGRP